MTQAQKRKLESDQHDSYKKSLLIGAGVSEESFINKIVDLVAEKIKSSSGEQKIGLGAELSPPTAELIPVSTSSPPLPFNNTILKNDDNDLFGKSFFYILL